MSVRRGLLALLLCVSAAGCGRETQTPFSPPTVDQALAACKISSISFVLKKSHDHEPAGKKAINTYFESCMSKKGWRRTAQCRPNPDGTPVHPMSEFAYVKTQCGLKECQLSTCYQPAKKSG